MAIVTMWIPGGGFPPTGRLSGVVCNEAYYEYEEDESWGILCDADVCASYG